MDSHPLMDTPRPRSLPADPRHRAWPALTLDRIHLVRGEHPPPGDESLYVTLCGRFALPPPADDDGSWPPCTSCRAEAGRLAISWPCCRRHYR